MRADIPGDDAVIGMVDNLGFGQDDTLTTRDLEVMSLHSVRTAISDAEGVEIEKARDVLKATLHYTDTRLRRIDPPTTV